MDEFKPEDELKPDTSDRRPTRPRKTSSAPKTPASRQRMMMGIGVLVLLLLIIGIGSALNGPDADKTARQPASGTTAGGGGNEKNIDLSGSSAMSGQGGSASGNAASGETASTSPQPISVPPVSSTPTQAAPLEAPQGQQRVELPGDLNSALSSQQGQVDAAAQGAIGSSSLPTAPATVSGNSGVNNSASVGRSAAAPRQNSAKPAQTHKPAASQTSARQNAAPAAKQNSKPAGSATHSSSAAGKASSGVPGGSYTLQLSSASRADTLNAWAKKQNLNNYHVYQTTRNGQPWYVLVSGSYATPADAKRAVSSLPAEVQAQKPWIKPVSQVKKEAGR
ncbi:Cell division protein DamX [Mixta theicola]|nr:SPOR domain-containing protein [Mixta theicola]QHM77171.1 Cell division protein DamX [Mixta theicola]